MRIVTSTVTREVIDAEITSAMYPGHVPARWALPLLDELDRVASGWQLVELDERELAALWLPAHDGERCHGDSMRLGEDERGATLEDSAAWLRRHADAYAAANPSCWGRISYAMERAPSRIVVSPINVGDRIKPGEASLVLVDGLHRGLAYWLTGRRTCEAYVPADVRSRDAG